MKTGLLVGALAVALPFGAAWAQESAIGADATHLICDAGMVIDCIAEGACSGGSPESVDLPRFLNLDLVANELSSPSPGFDGEITPLRSVDRSEGWIVISGRGRGNRVFSMSISESTGSMRGSVLAEDFAFLVFGACVELDG